MNKANTDTCVKMDWHSNELIKEMGTSAMMVRTFILKYAPMAERLVFAIDFHGSPKVTDIVEVSEKSVQPLAIIPKMEIILKSLALMKLQERRRTHRTGKRFPTHLILDVCEDSFTIKYGYCGEPVMSLSTHALGSPQSYFSPEYQLGASDNA